MKRIHLSFLIGLIVMVYSCSSPEAYDTDKWGNYVQNDSMDISLLNDIILDAKEQIPYVSDDFYTFDNEYLNDLGLKKEELDFIKSKNNKAVKYSFKDGDIKFYDISSNSVKSSTLIRTKEEGYNKNVTSISRPYSLNKNEVLIFYQGFILYDGITQIGPAGGAIWAVLYRKNEGKWKIAKHYAIVDMS